MSKIKTLFVLLALILASWPIYKPIFDYGFFPVHDDLQIQRVYEMVNAIKDGQFPARIVKNLGYGYHYPLFNFYAPLPYYVGALFVFLGFNYLFAGKAIFFIPNFLSIVFMFLLEKKITKNNFFSFLAGVAYAYFPYRAVDNYVRGVTGELFVMMFLPLLLIGISEIFVNSQNSNSKFLSLNFKLVFSLSGILLSHNIYAYLVCLGLFIFIFLLIVHQAFLLLIKKQTFLLQFAKSLVSFLINSLLSFLLTAFFWLPAILESKFTHVDKLSKEGYFFGNYFIPLKSLWQSEWGYGGAGGGMTFMIGKVHLFLFALALFIMTVRFIKTKKISTFSIFFLFLFFLTIFLTNKYSFFLWDKIPLLKLTQYPMRIIFFINFSLLVFFLSAFKDILQKINNLYMILFVLVISTVTIYKNINFFKSKYNYEFKDEEYLSEKYLKWASTIRGDEYLPKEFQLPIKENEISDGTVKTDKQVKINTLLDKSNEMKIQFENNHKNLRINFPITNFPGWTMYVNGKKENFFSATKYNLISQNFSKGQYEVLVKFENTTARTVGNIISLISLFSLIYLILKQKFYARQ